MFGMFFPDTVYLENVRRSNLLCYNATAYVGDKKHFTVLHMLSYRVRL